MPLESGASREVISANIGELVKAGHSQSQAAAIAYKEARQHGGKDEAPCAGIMYVANGRVLLMRRRDGVDQAGCWSFPAGHLEVGESPLQAAIRESIEETGHEPAGNLSLLRQDGDFTLYLCRGDYFSPVLNDEHDGFMWASPGNPPLPLHPGIAELLGNGMDKAIRARPADAYTGDFFAEDVESARQVDTNGWFEVRDNPISKAGVFPYRGSQIPGAPDPSKVYAVFRPPEELADPECVNSFRLVPWIDNHVMLGSEDIGMTPAEKKGVQGVIGEDVYFEGDTLYANLKVFSQALANAINAGKRELSCGYRCAYEWASGVFDGKHYDAIQRRIRGNHIASVNSGRMGSEVAVQDEFALDHFVFALDMKDTTMADEKKKDEKEESKGGGAASSEGTNSGKPAKPDHSGMTLAEAIHAVETLLPTLKKMAEHAGGMTGEEGQEEAGGAEAVPAAKVDEEGKDGMMGGKGKDADMAMPGGASQTPGKAPGDPDDKKKEGSGMDSSFKAVAKQFAARDALARQVSIHVGTFDHSEMTVDEVAAYGVAKLGLTPPKGAELATLQGFLAGRGDPARGARAAVATDSKGGGGNFVSRYLSPTA